MKRCDGYLLREIAGETYLIPYGQQVADFSRGLSLNETGMLLWNALAEEQTEASLTDLLAAEYAEAGVTREELTADVNAFLSLVRSLGMLTEGRPTLTPVSPLWRTLNIAGITMRLHGPADAFDAGLDAFAVPDCAHPDLTVDVVLGDSSARPTGRLILHNDTLSVLDCGETLLLFFPTSQRITRVRITRDGSAARLFLRGPVDDTFRYELFHALRHVYLFLAQQRGIFALHSVSILYQGKAWLFSGHSGMGKSTHTAMWHDIHHTPIINGDLNLLRIDSEGMPVVHGLPWCGTSGISTFGSWPLGGIVLLGRDRVDHVVPLTPGARALQTMQRLVSPVWTADMLDANLSFAARLTSLIPVYRLLCTKEPSAVAAIKAQIDLGLAGKDDTDR